MGGLKGYQENLRKFIHFWGAQTSPIAIAGTESKSDALEAMPTMAGLPSIYWPFIAIGIWHFVTAAGQTKLPICSITSIQLTLCQSKSCPTSARGRFWHEIREFVGTVLAGQDRMPAKRGDYILTIGPALASQEWWVCC